MPMVRVVQDLHARLQPLLMFFVDGASFINAEEREWDFLLAVHTEGDCITIVSLPLEPCPQLM